MNLKQLEDSYHCKISFQRSQSVLL
nr:unnamed protein product [Callosobruchus analis]